MVRSRPILIFDKNRVEYLPFPYVLTSYKVVLWSSLTSFEYITKDFEGYATCHLILEQKIGNKTIKIQVSNLAVEQQTIIKEFRYVARLNNVLEILEFNL